MTSQKEFPTIYEHNALIFSFVAIAIVFVLLRLHRRYRDKALRLDDALCAIALVGYLVYIVKGNVAYRLVAFHCLGICRAAHAVCSSTRGVLLVTERLTRRISS